VQVQEEAGGVGDMEVVVECIDDIHVGVDKDDDDVGSEESDEIMLGMRMMMIMMITAIRVKIQLVILKKTLIGQHGWSLKHLAKVLRLLLTLIKWTQEILIWLMKLNILMSWILHLEVKMKVPRKLDILILRYMKMMKM